jgi:hypothetical protein
MGRFETQWWLGRSENLAVGEFEVHFTQLRAPSATPGVLPDKCYQCRRTLRHAGAACHALASAT